MYITREAEIAILKRDIAATRKEVERLEAGTATTRKAREWLEAENDKVVTEDMIAEWESALERDEWPSGWVNAGGIVEGRLPKALNARSDKSRSEGDAPEAEPEAQRGAVLDEGSECRSFGETSYLEGVPGLAEDIKDGMATPPEDCVGQQDLEW